MPKRSNDIIVSKLEYFNLVEKIKEVFRQKVPTSLIFTGSRTSNIYNLLQQEINNVTGITLSKSFLLNLIMLKHNRRFQKVTYETLQKFIRSFSFLNSDHVLDGTQKIFWGVNQGLPPGAYIDSVSGKFIPWKKLKKELEEKVINRYPKLINPECKVELADFYGRKDWLVQIIDDSKNVIGSVTIGSNPYANWENDGLVRIGKALNDNSWVVYAVFARLHDGTYKTIRIYTEDEIELVL